VPESTAFVADDPKAVFIATMARELHQAGVATDALEETLVAVANAIGLQIQVFALPTNIAIAIGSVYRQRVVMLRMDPGRPNLRRIALLNSIYDSMLAGRIGYVEATQQLSALDDQPGYEPWLQIPGLLAIAVGVALLLGGGVRELIVSGTIGAVTGALSAFGARYAVIDRLFEVIAAFAGTLILALFTKVIGPTNIYISIVAGVVVLLPGYSLTLALHELANRNLVAGVARLGKVLSTLLALGCGALLGFTLLGPQLLQSADVRPHPVGATYWILAVVLLTVGLWVDLDARPREFPWVFAASFVAVATTKMFGMLPVHTAAAFASAFVCGIVANLGARFLRVPQPVMLVPALLVLVPGSLSYESILFAFQRNIDGALPLAANAIVNAILLVAGLLLSQIVFPSTTLRNQRASFGPR
jgi:uncharacterized membrane protein YjjP (DUF1212 family)